MAVITPAFLSTLNRGYRREFQTTYQATVEESFFRDVATVVPSMTASNTYGWLGDAPQLREWIGNRVVKDMKSSGYELQNKLYESTVGVPRTSIEDDTFGQFGPLMAMMGMEAANHPDRLISTLIENAVAGVCYDGQNFLDTDHPIAANHDGTGAVTTVSNYDDDAGSGDPLWLLLDTRKPLKPFIFQERTRPEFEAKTNAATSDDVFMADEYKWGTRYRCNAGYGFWQMAYGSRNDLTPANFEAYRTAMRKITADGGRPLGIRPNVCLVSPDNESAANRLFKTMVDANGASNPHYNACEVIVSSWLQ
ncbi:Mu-like prophage major head subunit gpT [Roseivivax halotolerans]|uniref:Mu-like prophage major head subunit gpT n=1 Tax=Roseivivax halotolerans TaxID=93684 RepID=A0A1I5W3L3_9RHOB|nr:Mu-like prophage major head subunit gpT family protein [Roseivivax halotolerans]SFQ14309.1 Mu-like prophage major head subunit gpT [Roseivivax halotolerans]